MIVMGEGITADKPRLWAPSDGFWNTFSPFNDCKSHRRLAKATKEWQNPGHQKYQFQIIGAADRQWSHFLHSGIWNARNVKMSVWFDINRCPFDCFCRYRRPHLKSCRWSVCLRLKNHHGMMTVRWYWKTRSPLLADVKSSESSVKQRLVKIYSLSTIWTALSTRAEVPWIRWSLP
jgi:hypothetical protein